MERQHLHDCQPGETYRGRECFGLYTPKELRTARPSFPPGALVHYFPKHPCVVTIPCVTVTQPAEPVVAEGEFKAAELHRKGIPAVALASKLAQLTLL